MRSLANPQDCLGHDDECGAGAADLILKREDVVEDGSLAA